MTTVAGSGTYTLNFPAGVSTLTLVPDPIDDADFEGNEIINFHLQSGAGYTVDTAKDFNRGVIQDPAVLGETELCTCGAGDDLASRAPKVSHDTNEAVEFVHKEHKPVYTGTAFLSNIDNGDNPVVVGVDASVGGVGTIIGPDVPTPAYQAESHVKAAVVGTYPSSTGLYGFSVGMTAYQTTVGGAWTSAGIEDSSLRAGAQYNDFLFVDWTNWWFGRGWGIEGLNSLFVKDSDTADVDVDGNNLVLREGDGSLIQFHRKLVSGQAQFVPEPGPWAGTKVTTSTPEGSWFDVRKPDGTVEHYSRNTPDFSGYVHYRLDYRKEADGSKTTYTYQTDPLGWFGGQRPWKITDKSGRTAVFGYDGNNHLSSVTYDAASGSIVSNTSVNATTGRLDSITDPLPEVSGERPLTNFEYDSNGRVTAKKERITDAPLKERTTAWAYDATTGDLTQVTNPDGSVRTYGYSQNATGVLAPWAGFSTVRMTDELGRDTRSTLDQYGNTLAELDAEGNLRSYVRNVNGQALQEIDIDPDSVGPLAAPTTSRVYDANQNLLSETAPDGGVRTWSYDSEFNRVTEEVDELGRRTIYKIDVTTTSPARTGTGNVLYKQEVVGTADGPLTYDFSTGVVTGMVDDRVTSYLYTPIPSGTYDLPGGLLLKERDALGQVTTYEYWNRNPTQPPGNGGNIATHGKLKKVTLPNVAGETAGSVYRAYTYDSNGNQYQVTDELGRVTTTVYDALGRLRTTTYADPYTDDANAAPYEETTYDRLGRQLTSRDKNGNITTYAYSYDTTNHLYRVTKIAPAREATSSVVTSYVETDAVGNQIRSVDGLGRVTTQVYDSLNRLRQSITADPDGAGPLSTSVTTYAYDRLGRQTATTEAGDLRNLNPTLWSTMTPSIEAGAISTWDVTTAVGTSELDLFAIFKDGQDDDSALSYSIFSNTNSALLDALSIGGTNPRKLFLDFAGATTGSGVVTVRATDTSGLYVDRAITINRSQAQNEIEFRLNTTTTGTQQAPALVATPSGGFVAVWEDTNTGVIRAQRFQDSGSTIGSEITVSQVANATVPSVAVAADGRLVFTYWRNASGSSRDLYRRTFDASGGNPGSETLVASYASTEAAPVRAAMTFLAGGESVIVWRNTVSGNSDILAQRYNISDATVGSAFTVNTTTSTNQLDPAVGATEDGGFTVVWHGNGSGDTFGVFSRRYLADFTALGNENLVNRTTTDTQVGAVLPNGAFVIVWYGAGIDAQTGLADGNDGIYARLYGADGTPANGEILVNQESPKNEQRPSVSMLPDGGFVVTWRTNLNDTSDVYARRFSAAGIALENEVLVNTTTTGSQTAPSVAVTTKGAVIVGWSGQGNSNANSSGDTSGIFGRLMTAYEPGTSQAGPFRVLGVSPGETVSGAVEKLIVTFSGPVDGTTVAAADFTVSGPAGSVTLGTSVMLSTTQVLLPLSTPQKAIGNYNVTVKPSISRTSGAGGGQVDQNLDGTAGSDPADRAEFAFFLSSGETDPVVGTVIPDITVSDTTTTRSTVDLSLYFQDGQQPSSELLYTVVGVTFNTNTIFRNVSVSESDVKTLFIDYEAGVGITGWADVTIRATDGTGRSVTDIFRVTRSTALATAPAASYFHVLSVDAYQQASGPIDRLTVLFSDAVNWTTFTSADVALTGPSGTVSIGTVVRTGTRQAVVPFSGGYLTALGAYTLTITPDIQNTAAKKIDQNDDGTTGDAPEDNFVHTYYLALGPRSRTEYDVNSRASKSFDASGAMTSYFYDAAGQQLGITDPLSRTTVSRYNEVGQLVATAQPYPQAGIDRDWDDGESGASGSFATVGSWTTVTPTGFEGDYRYINGVASGTSTSTWTLSSLTAGKTYEVLVTWGADAANNATNSPFRVFDNTTSLETVRLNQQRSPSGHPVLGVTWQTIGYYTPTSTTLKVELKNDADVGKRVVADAVRIVEVSADRYKYDGVGNLEYSTDARGSQTKNVYDARYRNTEVWQPDPTTGVPSASFKTLNTYDMAGQLTKVTDPLARETGYVYDNMGRKKQVLQANPSTGLISSGALVTDYRNDDLGNLLSVDQPDLGGTYGRPKTEYTYDKHSNVTKIKYADPDGTGSAYLTRSEINYQYDDLDRRLSEKSPRGVLNWSVYDDLDRTTAMLQPVADTGASPYDNTVDDGTPAPSGWTRTTNGSANGGDYSYTTDATGTLPLTWSVTGLTPGKSYIAMATWLAESTAKTTNARYEFQDGAVIEASVDVFQGAAPSGYYDGTRNWRPLAVFTADGTSATVKVTRLTTPDSAQRAVADAVRFIEVGPVTQYEFDPRGNTLRTKDPLGRVTQSNYDSLNREVSQIDPLGARTFAGFDLAGQQATQVDKLGRATTVTYDKLSRVITVTQPDPDAAGSTLVAPVVDFTYDAVGNRIQMTEPDPDNGGSLGRSITDNTFDRLNRLTKVERSDPDGASADQRPYTTFSYTIAGELDTTTQVLGTGAVGQPARSWKQEYDKLGRLTKVTAPHPTAGTATGPFTQFGYDALSRKTSETRPDPDGGGTLSVVTTWTYDNLGRLLKLEQPDPDGSGTLGRPTNEYAYDLAGNVTSMKTPDPNDADGSAEAVIVTSYAYDYLNRRVSETRNDPDGGGTLIAQTTAFAYDSVGNQTRTVEPDPDGTGILQPPVTWHTFDALNREVTTIDPREGVTRYTFDALGNRTSLTDPVLNKTSWVYDRLNRAIVDMNTFGDARRFDFDAVGRQTREVDRNGRVTKWTYDPLNRRTKEEWFTNEADATADRTLSWDYDVADQLESITDRDASNAAIGADYSYTYDRRGNALTTTSTLATLGTSVVATNTYDDLDRRLTFEADRGATADFRNEYQYDTLSRLTQVVQKNQSGGSGVADKHVKLTYNALSQSQKITRYSDAAGTTEEGHSDFVYDKFAHLISLDHETSASVVLTGYDWTFDNLNRVKSDDFVPAGFASEDVTTYGYDATDQLIATDRASGSDEAYVNDLNGNRRSSGTTNWVAGANNQLFRDGTYEYTYDKEGNLTKRVTLVSGSPTGATTEYAWDHRNRLKQITEKATPGGSATKTVKYEYDVYDLRVLKNVDTDANGTSNRFEFYVWDGDDVVLDFVDADGGASPSATISKRYLWGQAVDQILTEETAGGATVWDLADNLGTVRDQMDNSSALVSGSHISFDAFGRILSGTPQSRFTFTGQEWDADATLYYYNARWYNPGTGEFISIDPKYFPAGDTNLTRYVNNSPTNAVDPTGMDEWIDLDPNDLYPAGYVSMPQFSSPVGAYRAKIVAKSFINGVPNVGSINGWPEEDELLRQRASFVADFLDLDAFHQNPQIDARDGQYRLFTSVDVKFACCGDEISKVYPIYWSWDGGRELPGIYGSINLDGGAGSTKPTVNARNDQIVISWRGWGHPNLLLEPGQQDVHVRQSWNIWHKVEVWLDCRGGKGYHRVVVFTGSKFPSHRLWVNGVLDKDLEQGAFADLWTSSSTEGSTFVAGRDE